MKKLESYWSNISPIVRAGVTMLSNELIELSDNQLRAIFTTDHGADTVYDIIKSAEGVYSSSSMYSYATDPYNPEFLEMCEHGKFSKLIFLLSAACAASKQGRVLIPTKIFCKQLKVALSAEYVELLKELVNSHTLSVNVLETCFDKNPSLLAKITYCHAALVGKLMAPPEVLWRMPFMELTCTYVNDCTVLKGYVGEYTDRRNFAIEQLRRLLVYYTDVHIDYAAMKKTRMPDNRVYDYVMSLDRTTIRLNHILVYDNKARVLIMGSTRLIAVFTEKYFGTYMVDTVDGADVLYKLDSAIRPPSGNSVLANILEDSDDLDAILDRYINKFGGKWNTKEIVRLLGLCHIDTNKIACTVKSILD